MPTLAVIIPTYNRGEMLEATLASVLRIAWRPLHVTVVDDGSTDDTEQRMRRLIAGSQATGVTIDYLAQARQGVTHARNAGINASDSDWILFVDSDDLVEPAGVANLMTALATTDVEFVYGKVALVGEDGWTPLNRQVGRPFQRAAGYCDLLGYHWHTMGAVYRRSLVNRAGPWEESVNVSGSDDWEFQARVKACAQGYIFVDSIVGYWRQHGGPRLGVTSFNARYIEGVFHACELIAGTAARAGVLHLGLRLRLMGRIYRHKLECAAHADRSGMKLADQSITRLAGAQRLPRAVSWVAKALPPALGNMTLATFNLIKEARSRLGR